MIFDRNESKGVIALLGAGAMGCAIVRRIATGRKVLFGDISDVAGRGALRGPSGGNRDPNPRRCNRALPGLETALFPLSDPFLRRC